MEIHFCDLCNESVPESDLALGRAVRRGARVVCQVCERAMSAPAAGPAAAGLAPPAPGPPALPGLPQVAGVPPGPGGSAAPRPASAGAFLALVALLFAAGATAWLTGELNAERERRQDGDRRRSLAEEALADRLASGLAALRAEREHLAGELGRRLEALERDQRVAQELQRGRLEAQGATLAELGAGLAALRVEQARAREEDGRRLDELAARFAARREELAGLEARLEALQQERSANVAPAAVQPVAEAAWKSRLGDLASGEASLRYYAVLDLAASADPAVVPHLVPLLADGDTFVRMAVARVLGELGAPAAIEPLIGALEDPLEEVRETAVLSLRSITGRNFRFDPFANPAERARRVGAWREWWAKAKSDYL